MHSEPDATGHGDAPVTAAKCELCGEPMPPGEEMFKFHGYSGDCPKPPLLQEEAATNLPDDVLRGFWQSVQGPLAQLNGPLIRFAGLVYQAAITKREQT